MRRVAAILRPPANAAIVRDGHRPGKFMTLRLAIENLDRLPDGGPLRVEVKGRGLDIGRDAHLDWTLPDPSRHVSGKHCEIRYRDDEYWLYDVSNNGMFVNGSTYPLDAPYRLRDQGPAGDRALHDRRRDRGRAAGCRAVGRAPRLTTYGCAQRQSPRLRTATPIASATGRRRPAISWISPPMRASPPRRPPRGG